MATELTPYNINVNAICPGVVHTDMWDKVILPYYAKEWGMSTKDAWEQWIQKIPVQRPQTAEDIGNAVVFLASEESRNITGDAMAITGGYLMH